MTKLLHKATAETNPNYGCHPKKRPMEEHLHKSIINLDKPMGPTSHQVDSWVKKILRAEKTGHGGTLDPRVTGVLPVGVDDATRAIQLLLSAPKEYVCLMRLHHPVAQARVCQVLEEFTGKIFQTPPLRSAVKRELRVRSIYYVHILEMDEQDVLFRIGCEAGTYIRKYCHDVGEALGVGAHMAELRRTRVGSFQEDTLHTLQDLTDAYVAWQEGDETLLRECLLPMEAAASHLPLMVVRDSAVDALCHGADLAAGGILALSPDLKSGDMVRVETLKGELVAAGLTLQPSREIQQLSQGIMVDIKKVFMEPGTYPRMWK
ncbi:MAG TPA: RNA-guided pseudouridylation complex pseudouridine synthase subunit Cbf5 [Methanobacteriaceae archaeon]|jgi:H/ACA ribonucleoprotein complex subunit 4|nr:RNA-guided pseudouridylation complex pseudouridine synthase subunit Cbf5 [Euryarchaeota archaeon]HNR25158.1 RNA-guided pseudouridylation complex pseudouridine synthase subunit Cbf5 [Methanobacteriaceae archaeon]